MNYGVKGTRTSILQIQQEPLPGGPIGAGGGRDQLAPTPYQLPRLARPEGCCDMSCDCLSKYHGRASRDALRVWSGWASTVIHGPRYEPDYGPRYEPDYGPCYASGRRATPRVGPPGRATRRAAGRAALRTIYSATAPLDLRTNGQTTPMHVATCLATASASTMDGPAGTHCGSGAAGLLR